jgi:hypothetical protein
LISVPAANDVGSDAVTAADSRSIKVVVSTTTATGTVSASATGGLRLLTVAQEADADSTSATGTTTLSGAAVSSSFTFYVYTTSTTAGTLTVTEGGNTKVNYINEILLYGCYISYVVVSFVIPDCLDAIKGIQLAITVFGFTKLAFLMRLYN